MLHPATELRFVSQEIGYGIFATENIPLGTITWVKDELDRVFSTAEVNQMSEANRENLLKYTYRDKKGDYLFCWDLTRYVNHSYFPNSMLTSLGFEIAIRDIKKGDEITNDYGTFNIIESFRCAKGPHVRELVHPDDLTRLYRTWDEQIERAMRDNLNVHQPLEKFLSREQKDTLKEINSGKRKMPSVLENYFDTNSSLK